MRNASVRRRRGVMASVANRRRSVHRPAIPDVWKGRLSRSEAAGQAGDGAHGGARSQAKEVATPHVQTFVGDLRARNVRRSPDKPAAPRQRRPSPGRHGGGPRGEGYPRAPSVPSRRTSAGAVRREAALEPVAYREFRLPRRGVDVRLERRAPPEQARRHVRRRAVAVRGVADVEQLRDELELAFVPFSPNDGAY